MGTFDCLYSFNLCLVGLGCPLLRGSSDRRLRRCAATTCFKHHWWINLYQILPTNYSRFSATKTNFMSYGLPMNVKAFPLRVSSYLIFFLSLKKDQCDLIRAILEFCLPSSVQYKYKLTRLPFSNE